MMGHVEDTFSDKRTTYKVLQSGYYWRTLFKDAMKYVRSCDSCQRMGRPTAADEMPLRPQVVIDHLINGH
jgi:hypothetical protein